MYPEIYYQESKIGILYQNMPHMDPMGFFPGENLIFPFFCVLFFFVDWCFLCPNWWFLPFFSRNFPDKYPFPGKEQDPGFRERKLHPSGKEENPAQKNVDVLLVR